MLLAVEQETTNNFMFFTFGFFVIFGYFGYRLVYRWLDHIANTQRIDQYAKHFGDNKHLITSLEQNIFGLISSVESHLYIATICALISEPITTVISIVLGFIGERHHTSTLSGLVQSIITALTKYIYTPVATPVPAHDTRAKKYRQREPIRCNQMFGQSRPQYTYNGRIPKCERIHDGACPWNNTDFDPRIMRNLNERISQNMSQNNQVDVPFSFTSTTDLRPTENNLPNTDKCQNMITNAFADLKTELGNNPTINTFCDLVSTKLKSYNFQDTMSVNANLLDFNSYIIPLMLESNISELINDAIKVCVADGNRTSVMKEIFCVFNSVSTTKIFPEIEDLWALSQKIVCKYMECPMESLAQMDPYVLSILKSMIDKYNEQIRQIPSPTDTDASRIFADFFSVSDMVEALNRKSNTPSDNTALLNMIERANLACTEKTTNPTPDMGILQNNSINNSIFDQATRLSRNYIANKEQPTGVTGGNLVQPIPVTPLNIAEMFEFATTFQESETESIDYSTLDYTSTMELLSILRKKLGFSSNFIITVNSLNVFPKPNQYVSNFLRLTCFVQLGKDLFSAVYGSENEEEIDIITEDVDNTEQIQVI